MVVKFVAQVGLTMIYYSMSIYRQAKYLTRGQKHKRTRIAWAWVSPTEKVIDYVLPRISKRRNMGHKLGPRYG